MVKALVAKYPTASVSSLDIVQRHFPEKPQWTFYPADLTSLSDLSAAIKKSGATTVIHTARPSSSSSPLYVVLIHALTRRPARGPARGKRWYDHSAPLIQTRTGPDDIFQCEKVNVTGTQTVVDACVQEGVRKLIYTSSAGTVYNGQDLINVDERLPFPTTGLDAYNITKVSISRCRP